MSPLPLALRVALDNLLDPDRQTLPDARRQTLTWLISGVEQLGGRRIAVHLLRESVDGLPEQTRNVCQMLLAPHQIEELVGPPSV